jgi:hypothetical protein
MSAMSENDQKPTGNPGRTLDSTLLPSCAKASLVDEQRELRKAAAADAIDEMFSICNVPDVADHRAFLSCAIAILSGYPIEVMRTVATEVPTNFKRPMLDDIRDECEAAYRPIAARLMRERALRSLPPPATDRPRLSKEEIEARLGRRIG